MPGRVLVVEDEYLIRLLLEDMLEELGFEVAGVASSVAEGKEQAATAQIDLAILDVNIDGEQVFPVAEVSERPQPAVLLHHRLRRPRPAGAIPGHAHPAEAIPDGGFKDDAGAG